MHRVLLVDDDRNMLSLTEDFLGKQAPGIQFISVSSAEEARFMLKTETFNAIVSDYQMPVTDGLEFLAELRESGNQIPFIIFTGRGREEVAIKALNLGADYYLKKGNFPAAQYAELANILNHVLQFADAKAAVMASERKCRQIFAKAPICLWQEDCRKLGLHIRSLQDQGIDDFDAYFRSKPEELIRCVGLSELVEANETALVVHRAKCLGDVQSRHTSILEVFDPEIQKNVIVAMANNQLRWQGRTHYRTLLGNHEFVRLEVMFIREGTNPPTQLILTTLTLSAERGHEASLGRNKRLMRSLTSSPFEWGFWRGSDTVSVYLPAFAFKHTENGFILVQHNKVEAVVPAQIAPPKLGDSPNKLFDSSSGIFENLERCYQHRTRMYQEFEGTEKEYKGTITGITFVPVPPDIVLMYTEDISEARAIEDTIIQREREVSGLLSHLPGMVYRCTFDEGRQFRFVNSFAKALTGRKPSDILWNGSHPYDDLIHPEDHQKTLEQIRRSLDAGMKQYQAEYRIRNSHGDWQWVLDQGRRIDAVDAGREDGTVVLEGFVTDVTNQKTASAALKNYVQSLEKLIESLPLPVYYKGTDGVFMNCNEAFAMQLFGVGSQVVNGCTEMDFLDPSESDDANMLHVKDLELIRKSGCATYEASIRCADGDTKDFICCRSTFKNSEGKAAGLLGVMLEITDRKRAAEQVRREREELSQFASTMVHDLRSSVSSIRGFAQLIVEDSENKYAMKIDKIAIGVYDMLSRSLELANAGLIATMTDTVNLTALITEVANRVVPDGVSFETGLLPDVNGDPQKLRQVFQNLLENAVVHGKPKFIKVKHRIDCGGSVVSIHNDGEMITAKNRKMIFSQGFSTRASGGGMGLRIVQRIIAAHGWQIRLAHNEDWKGNDTVFEVLMPIE